MAGRPHNHYGLPRGYMAEAAKRASISRQAVDYRAARGWPLHALHEETRPAGPTRPELVLVNAMFWGIDEPSLAAKARAAGLSRGVVAGRIKILGWSEEKALATPVGAAGPARSQLRLRADELGIKIGTVRMRIRHGWDEERAVTTPAYPVRGPRPGSLNDLAQKAGLSYGTVRQRMKVLGWSLERALSTPLMGPFGRARSGR